MRSYKSWLCPNNKKGYTPIKINIKRNSFTVIIISRLRAFVNIAHKL